MGAACCSEEKQDFSGEGHFNLLRSVGKGAFGKVRVVQHKGTKKIYALKYINKEKCIEMKAVDNIIQERKLLEEIDNEFVCNMRYAFQDDENMFMVIDLMLGGDLRFHLDRMGTFTTEMIRLYSAEIACGLAYLHTRYIVHRDLKPDNDGHAHLTDFNIAVRFRDDKPLTAVAGSMAYMAPEILYKKGYYASVDWWSLGVILYELAVGKRPFRSKTNEGLTHAIMYEEIEWPTEGEPIDEPMKDFIQQLLIRDISERLGTKFTGGYEALKKHKFFASIDWAVLEKKKAATPFVPDSKKANFDATHELEELLLEDNPLKAKPRKKKGDTVSKIPEPETPMTRSLQIIEEKFTVYDFSKIQRAEVIVPPEELKDVYEGQEHITYDEPKKPKVEGEEPPTPT